MSFRDPPDSTSQVLELQADITYCSSIWILGQKLRSLCCVARALLTDLSPQPPEESSRLWTPRPECIYIESLNYQPLPATDPVYCVTLLSPCLPQTPVVFCVTLSPLLTFEDTRGDVVQWGQSHVLTVSSPKALVSKSWSPSRSES